MSASSQSAILKNIYSFLDVLQLSHTDVVSQWDKQALENALRWARYAEQIYRQSQGKSYLPELEAQIRKLARLPWSLGCRNINLQLLSSATEELSLVLLQNPCLPPALLESLLMTTWDLHAGGDRLIEACYKLCKVKSEAHIFHTLYRHQRNKVTTSTGLSLEALQAYAKLMLDHFSSVLENAVPEKKERTEALLKKNVSKIFDAKHGNEILLCSLFLSYEDSTITQPTLAQKFVFQVTEEIVMNDESKAKRLWSASPSLLCQVSVAYPDFYTHYMGHLCHVGEAMIPEYPPLEEHRRHLGPLVQWRPTSPDGLTYDQLLHHFRGLLQQGRHLVKPTQTKLQTMAAEAECCVWRYLQKDLKDMPVDIA